MLGLGLGTILLAGIAAIVQSRSRNLPGSPRARGGFMLFRVLLCAGCTIGALSALRVLVGGATTDLRFSAAGPAGPWVFGSDALSAVFLLLIFAVGAASGCYGFTYFASHAVHGEPDSAQLSVEAEPSGAAGAHALIALLLVSLALVVVARAVIPFLIAWELMAMTAYFLIVFDEDKPEVRRAGLLYLVTTHAGTLLLFALFATWGRGAADLSFAALAAVTPHPRMGGAVVLSLALAGFGLKAGLVPLHFWLPEAHAAAPSHVSALMSGVVIKMGIYGLLRVIALLGIVPAWWSWLVLGLGVISGVLGVVWALAQHDIKRLLAFHSVENIGIILLGVGIGGLGLAYHHPGVAILGFAGALLHTFNHALFKSLLFLGAGSVIHATGARDIERLGGLSRRMPLTAAAFLVGSVAIVGLPPLNGFVSEWMVYRGILHIGLVTDISRIASLAGVALALIGGLALACFAKVVGILYLGSPRDPVALAAHESAPGMTWPLLGLAGACAGIGLLPVFVLPPILRAAAVVVGAVASDPSMTSTVAADVDGSAAMAITALALGVTVSLLIGWAVRRIIVGRRPSKTKAARLRETWACGYSAPTARMQYTASSFAAPILAHFQPVTGVRTHQTTRVFETYARDPVLDGFVRPLWRAWRDITNRARPMQRARLSTHVLYLVAALLTLLVYLLVGRWTP